MHDFSFYSIYTWTWPTEFDLSVMQIFIHDAPFFLHDHETIKQLFREIGCLMNLPYTYHVHYIKFISINFMRCFKNKEMKFIVINIGLFKFW